jgi:cell division protein FtsB
MEPMPRLSPASPPRTPVRRAAKFQPKARKPLPRGPRLLTYALVFVAVGLLVDAVFGDRGLLDTMRAERQNAALAERIDRLRDENARLREEAQRLREDPKTIESAAREQLDLIHPGETMFIIADGDKNAGRRR